LAVQTFVTPASAEDAVRLMAEHPAKARYVAGGTDLMCQTDRPDFLINIENLLRYRKREKGEFVIGASTTVAEIGADEKLAELDAGLFRECAQAFATLQIRNMATVGGNLASSVPSADLAPPLLVLDAQAVILNSKGRRTVPLTQFFSGAHENVLGNGLLLEVRFPVPESGVKTTFLKVGRNPGDIAQISVAALAHLEQNVFQKVRIALGAVYPTPLRAFEAEAFLQGKPAHAKNIQRAAELAQAAVRTISDQRASAEYRRYLSLILTRRALQHLVRGQA